MPPPSVDVVETGEPPHEPEPFRCEVSRQHESARLRTIGELDLATAPIVRAEIAALREAGVRQMILDLSGLAFMDSSGLRFILDTDDEARQDGFSIALIAGPPAVQRVFELTKTVAHLPFPA